MDSRLPLVLLSSLKKSSKSLNVQRSATSYFQHCVMISYTSAGHFSGCSSLPPRSTNETTCNTNPEVYVDSQQLQIVHKSHMDILEIGLNLSSIKESRKQLGPGWCYYYYPLNCENSQVSWDSNLIYLCSGPISVRLVAKCVHFPESDTKRPDVTGMWKVAVVDRLRCIPAV